MTPAYQQLLEAVRALPTRERLAMIQTLLEDMKEEQPDPGISAQQQAELTRRMEAFYSGDMPVISGTSAMDRLRRKIGR